MNYVSSCDAFSKATQILLPHVASDSSCALSRSKPTAKVCYRSCTAAAQLFNSLKLLTLKRCKI